MKTTIIPRRWENIPPEEQEKILHRSGQDIEDAAPLVRPIVEAVASEGDAALRRYTLEFDKADISGLPLRVSEEEFVKAEASLNGTVQEAIRFAVGNVRKFHLPQKREEQTLTEISPGVFAGEKVSPVESAGLYVPRGRGSFPSMLYMLALPAVIAGVPEIRIVTPPNTDGSVDPGCLYAARLCGVSEVYRVGGAQAIAALAYGTESVGKTVKITGPGSMYVAAAKRLVSHIVDTGLPAGPSESVIIADAGADPEKVALDLLTEAEHGSDSQALLLTPSVELAAAVSERAAGMIDELPEPRKGFIRDVFAGYGGIIITESLEAAAGLSNRIAPEHLQIQTADPFDLLPRIVNAGEILLGDNTPFSAANYVIGANAVLPTGGGAKTYSAVSVRDFVKYSSVVYSTRRGCELCAPRVAALAGYEGFITHGNAVTQRPGGRGSVTGDKNGTPREV